METNEYEKIRRSKPCKDIKGCMWVKDHKGPHSLACKGCKGKGVVSQRENWVRCLVCRGRGWTDIKRRKADKTCPV